MGWANFPSEVVKGNLRQFDPAWQPELLMLLRDVTSSSNFSAVGLLITQ